MCNEYYYAGCPANEENDQGMTPQKLAKQEGLKDAMKELKKLTSFQDKLACGAKPKGAAEPWAVQVCRFCGAGRNEGGSERGGDGI